MRRGPWLPPWGVEPIASYTRVMSAQLTRATRFQTNVSSDTLAFPRTRSKPCRLLTRCRHPQRHELVLPSSCVPGDSILVCAKVWNVRAAIWRVAKSTDGVPILPRRAMIRLYPITRSGHPRFWVYFLQSGFTQLGIFEGAGNKTTSPSVSGSLKHWLRVRGACNHRLRNSRRIAWCSSSA